MARPSYDQAMTWYGTLNTKNSQKKGRAVTQQFCNWEQYESNSSQEEYYSDSVDSEATTLSFQEDGQERYDSASYQEDGLDDQEVDSDANQHDSDSFHEDGQERDVTQQSDQSDSSPPIPLSLWEQHVDHAMCICGCQDYYLTQVDCHAVSLDENQHDSASYQEDGQDDQEVDSDATTISLHAHQHDSDSYQEDGQEWI